MFGAKYINFGAKVLNNFQCGGVQLICRTIGQGPTGLAVGAGRDCCLFSLSPSFFLSLGNGSKFIEILAQRIVKPKATTNQLYECLIYFLFLFICSFNFYYIYSFIFNMCLRAYQIISIVKQR